MVFLFIMLMAVLGRMDVRIMIRRMVMVAAAVMAFVVMMMRHALFQNRFDHFFQHRNRSFLNKIYSYIRNKTSVGFTFTQNKC